MLRDSGVPTKIPPGCVEQHTAQDTLQPALLEDWERFRPRRSWIAIIIRFRAWRIGHGIDGRCWSRITAGVARATRSFITVGNGVDRVPTVEFHGLCKSFDLQIIPKLFRRIDWQAFSYPLEICHIV